MQRAPSRVEQVLRGHVCERCDAQPDHPCRTRSGKPRSDSHASRFYAAQCAGDVPLDGPEQPTGGD